MMQRKLLEGEVEGSILREKSRGFQTASRERGEGRVRRKRPEAKMQCEGKGTDGHEVCYCSLSRLQLQLMEAVQVLQNH